MEESNGKSKALQTVNPLALAPRNIEEGLTISEYLSKSSLVPDAFRGKPADIFLAINYGGELGLPPVSSLRAVAVIKGKPSLYADAMVGVALSSGKAEYFKCVESSPEMATYETCRDGVVHTKTFTLADAKKANLLRGSGYQNYPTHMLEARAKAWLARDVYPDVLHGIYSAEEVSEFAETRDVRTEGPIIGVVKVAPAEEAPLDNMEGPDPLGEMFEGDDVPDWGADEEETITDMVQTSTPEELRAMLPRLLEIQDERRKEIARHFYRDHKQHLDNGNACDCAQEWRRLND